jgi:hypothetical protein
LKWADRITLDFEVSAPAVAQIEELLKLLPEEISFVGGPFDGFSRLVTRENPAPKMLLIKYAGLTSVYELGSCNFWRYYEWKADHDWL